VKTKFRKKKILFTGTLFRLLSIVRTDWICVLAY